MILEFVRLKISSSGRLGKAATVMLLLLKNKLRSELEVPKLIWLISLRLNADKRRDCKTGVGLRSNELILVKPKSSSTKAGVGLRSSSASSGLKLKSKFSNKGTGERSRLVRSLLLRSRLRRLGNSLRSILVKSMLSKVRVRIPGLGATSSLESRGLLVKSTSASCRLALRSSCARSLLLISSC